MKTITIEEAYKFGQRAHSAGMRFAWGMVAIYWNPGEEPATDLVVLLKTPEDCIYTAEATLMSELATEGSTGNPVSGFSDTVPDLRDPGTKGHAVAQLRDRTGDDGLCVARRPSDGTWHMLRSDGSWLGFGPTEEEAIVHTFEETKETP